MSKSVKQLLAVAAFFGLSFCCCGGLFKWSEYNQEQQLEEAEAEREQKVASELRRLEEAKKSKDWKAGRRAYDAIVTLSPGEPVGEHIEWMNKAELPDTLKAMREATSAERWPEVVQRADRVLVLDPNNEEATAQLATANEEIRKLQFQDNERRLAEAVQVGDQALKKVDCRSDDYGKNLDTLKEIWSSISNTPEESEHRRDAEKLTRRLERCRTRVKKVAEKRICEASAEARQVFTDKMDTTFLNEGMDVRMRLSGKCKTRIRLKWVLWNRASVHQFANGGFLEGAKAVGFEKVTFSDGYDESYIYDDLEKGTAHPEVALQGALSMRGMDKRLELPAG